MRGERKGRNTYSGQTRMEKGQRSYNVERTDKKWNSEG